MIEQPVEKAQRAAEDLPFGNVVEVGFGDLVDDRAQTAAPRKRGAALLVAGIVDLQWLMNRHKVLA
ncbi:hypothetical protein [Rhodopseudomonas palustris]|uniref:hypothetical protein n=1 Tax=Rhodopseudomonas palustris TaxID=1076 RepID=UPI0011C496D4|nr:hypothetical protein [Rhodopseudomonas palustris]